MKIAVLHEGLVAQLRTNPAEAEGLELAHHAATLDDFRRGLAAARVSAVVLDLELLGADPAARVVELREAANAQLAVVLYGFAPAQELRTLTRANARLLRTPLRLAALRAAMMGVIVKEILKARDEEEFIPPPPRFNKAQLGELLEISSSVDCECPNNVASLVSDLLSFERYAQGCENKNPKDAEVHHMLWRETVRARDVMERALVKLCEHEKIPLPDPS